MEVMQTRVRGNQMLQSVEDGKRIKRELDVCVSELAQIRRRLTELSNLDLQIKKIRQLEEQIQTEGQYSILFANAIVNICGLYERNENRLVDYSDAVGRIAKREALSNQNLQELNKIFHKVLF